MNDNIKTEFDSISPEDAASMLASGTGKLFDVRTTPEFQSHRIKGAYLLPIQELHVRHDEIPRDSTEPVLIVCEHGVRSIHASRALCNNGWQNIVNVSGGMAAWMAVGLPVEKGG